MLIYDKGQRKACTWGRLKETDDADAAFTIFIIVSGWVKLDE